MLFRFPRFAFFLFFFISLAAARTLTDTLRHALRVFSPGWQPFRHSSHSDSICQRSRDTIYVTRAIVSCNLSFARGITFH